MTLIHEHSAGISPAIDRAGFSSSKGGGDAPGGDLDIRLTFDGLAPRGDGEGIPAPATVPVLQNWPGSSAQPRRGFARHVGGLSLVVPARRVGSGSGQESGGTTCESLCPCWWCWR